MEVQNQNPTLDKNPNLFDPETNIAYGIMLLEHYSKEAKNDQELLALYNGGYRQLTLLRNGEPLARETASYLGSVIYRRNLLADYDGMQTGLPYEHIVERILKSREQLFKPNSRADFRRDLVAGYIHFPGSGRARVSTSRSDRDRRQSETRHQADNHAVGFH
jgi:hypothetical protein